MGVLASLISAAALAATPGQAAPVQTPPPASAPQEADLGAIDVTGERIDERAAAFVEQIAAPPPGRGLARWDRAICVGAANMDRRYAQHLIDRVSVLALELELEIGEPGCRPNIIIAAAADADDLAAALVRDDPDGYRPSVNHTDLGRRALERFQTTDAPVRWWQVSLPVSVDTGDIAVRLNGEEAPTVRVRDASRLRSNIRDDLARVVVIIDTTRIGGTSWSALSDYVALVALAQVDPGADASAWPSVLNLFVETPPPPGLTEWDRDYLQALYAASRDRARPAAQAREIVRGMVRADQAAATPVP